MKNLSRLRSGVNHGILLAFTSLAIVNCVLGEQFTQYANLEKEAVLLCNSTISNLNASHSVVWSFSPFNGDASDKRILDCSNTEDTTPYKCSPVSKESQQNSLTIKKVSNGDFGVYSCGSPSSFSIALREIIKPSIKVYEDDKWKILKTSLRIEEGASINVGCFIDGNGFEKDKHEIVWRFARENNSLEDPNNHDMFEDIEFGETESFENITNVFNDSLTSIIYEKLEGPVNLNMRGRYICEVRLKNENQSRLFLLQFPADTMSSILFIRVVEGKGWVLPGIILLCEIILVGLFTLIITLKERKEGAIDGDYADSEDEEDDPKKETETQVFDK